MSFDLEALVSACKVALGEEKPQEHISKIVDKLLSDPDSLSQALGHQTIAGIEKLYVSDELTIINVVWAPKMTLNAHNHNVWAVIGVYAGREDNIFWRRVKNDPNGKIEAAGAISIAAGESASLGKNLIHSVTNPTDTFTRAIHIYGGNFFEIERSEWEPMSLEEAPYSVEKTLAVFQSENAIMDALKVTRGNY